jgi:hypothetical protein
MKEKYFSSLTYIYHIGYRGRKFEPPFLESLHAMETNKRFFLSQIKKHLATPTNKKKNKLYLYSINYENQHINGINCVYFQVRQYIYSVNGVYVLRSDHKTVGKLIMQSVSHVTLVIMTHKRDAGM